MSNAIRIQLVTAVVMAVAATPQYPSDMAGHLEGVAGYEVTNPDDTKTWYEETAYLALYENFGLLSFAQAIHLANNGHKIACSRWNTFYKHVKLGTTFPTLPPLSEIGDGTMSEYPTAMVEDAGMAFFDITAENGNEVFTNWRPSHYDLQSSVWYLWTQEIADAEFAAWQAKWPDKTYDRG